MNLAESETFVESESRQNQSSSSRGNVFIKNPSEEALSKNSHNKEKQ